jgi:hypothetical protein
MVALREGSMLKEEESRSYVINVRKLFTITLPQTRIPTFSTDRRLKDKPEKCTFHG